MRKVFEISGQEFLGVYRPAAAEFLGSDHSQRLARATLQAVESGDTRATLVPVADFSMEVSLRACRALRPSMPKEVKYRGLAAGLVSYLAVQQGVIDELFIGHYQKNDHLKRLGEFVDPEELGKSLTDAEALRSLGEAPPVNEATVVGGALRALQKAKIRQGEAAMIRRSPNLQLVSHIPTDAEDAVYAHLGEPYARTNRFVLPRDTERGTIRFAKPSGDTIKSHMRPGAGCPAWVASPEGEPPLFPSRHDEILEVLLADGAQATDIRELPKMYQEDGPNFYLAVA